MIYQELLNRHIWKKDLYSVSWDRDKYGYNLHWVSKEKRNG